MKVSQGLYAVTVLGIADLLADGPRDVADLAAAAGAHAPSLYRLLRAVASVGVLREEDGRRFALTPMGECLRSDAPDPIAGWAAFVCQPYQWAAWGRLVDGVQSGDNAFRLAHGLGEWEYRAQHPELSAEFDRAMTDSVRRQIPALLAAYDFGRFARLVDVGGGQGTLLTAVLAQHADMRGVLFDQPHVVGRAAALLRAAGVAERCEVVAGDFFAAVPSGGDAYLLKSIVHDWEDEQATAILRSCRAAIVPDGRLLVIERDLGAPNENPAAKFTDLTMLVGPGGKERTQAEYAALLGAAGFRLSDVASAGDFVIFEGVPV